jgi:serine/threonine-protein phosphatase Stp1
MMQKKPLHSPPTKSRPCPPGKEAIAGLYLSFAYSGYGLLCYSAGEAFRNRGARLPMHDGKMTFRSVSRTHTGLVRSHNEDSLVERSDVGLWAVSDGMGGHAAGDVASGLVVAALGQLPRDRLSPDGVREALDGVNDDLLARSSGAQDRTMGATVTVMGSNGSSYFCLWAGDSRLYRLRNAKLTQLTRDHRFIQDLLDSGRITEAEARSHPRRNVITRAVGVAKVLELEGCDGTIEAGDVFLLVTDGVTGACTDEEILTALTGKSLDEAADDIVSRCLDHGAPDNLTLLLIGKS